MPSLKTWFKPSVLLPHVSSLPPPPSCPPRRGCSVSFSKKTEAVGGIASCFPAWTMWNHKPAPCTRSPSPSFLPLLSARAGNTILAHSTRKVAQWVFLSTTSFFSFPFSPKFSSVLKMISVFPSYQDLLPFTVPQTPSFPLTSSLLESIASFKLNSTQ